MISIAELEFLKGVGLVLSVTLHAYSGHFAVLCLYLPKVGLDLVSGEASSGLTTAREGGRWPPVSDALRPSLFDHHLTFDGKSVATLTNNLCLQGSARRSLALSSLIATYLARHKIPFVSKYQAYHL